MKEKLIILHLGISQDEVAKFVEKLRELELPYEFIITNKKIKTIDKKELLEALQK